MRRSSAVPDPVHPERSHFVWLGARPVDLLAVVPILWRKVHHRIMDVAADRLRAFKRACLPTPTKRASGRSDASQSH